MPVHLRKVPTSARALLKTEESWNFSSRQSLRNLQKCANVRLREQSIVFRVDEHIIVTQAIGEDLFVSERKRPRIGAIEVNYNSLDTGRHFLGEIRQNDDVHVEGRGTVFGDQLR